MINNKSQLKLPAGRGHHFWLPSTGSKFHFFLIIFPFWVLDPPQNYHYNHNHQADHIRCGTIMDLVVCQLLGLDKPVTSPQVRFCLQCLRRVTLADKAWENLQFIHPWWQGRGIDGLLLGGRWVGWAGTHQCRVTSCPSASGVVW